MRGYLGNQGRNRPNNNKGPRHGGVAAIVTVTAAATMATATVTVVAVPMT